LIPFRKLPKEVLNLFPTWEYCCPDCGTYVDSDVVFCPNCKIVRNEGEWRVPPRFLKNPEAMSNYAHDVLAPKLTQEERGLLFQYFTEFLNSGWEDSGGSDLTDNGKWSGSGSGSGNTHGGCRFSSPSWKLRCSRYRTEWSLERPRY